MFHPTWGTDEKYIHPEHLKTSMTLEKIAKWSEENMMILNPKKSKYLIFSRSKSNFSTRLDIEGSNLERQKSMKLCGVWLSENLSWDRHVKEMGKNAFARMQMLSKLKFVGLPTEDLIEIYCLFIRSVLEYCSMAFHSSLSKEQSQYLEFIQVCALKVILGPVNFVSSSAAREMCGLSSLEEWRDRRLYS